MSDAKRDRTSDYRRLESASPAFRLKIRILSHLLRALLPGRVERVWDAGCGAGTLSGILVNYAKSELLVTDFESSSVAMTTERLGGASAPRVVGKVLDLETAATPPGSFDLILCWAVLEHLEKDGEGLSLLARSLAPGGKLILNVPLHPSLMNELDRLENHFRRYALSELRGKVESAGLCPLHVKSFGFPSLLLTKLLWARFAGREEQASASPIARALAAIMAGVDYVFYRIGFPWGVEGIVVANRPEESS